MKKITMILALLCAAVLLFGACSSSSPSSSSASEDYAASPMEAPQAAVDSFYEGEAAYTEEAVADTGGGVGDLPNASIPETSRKLIYSSSFEIETTHFDADYSAIKTALSGVNGYVENENTYEESNDYGGYRYSSLALRVPMDKYNSFLDTLSGIGKVVDKQIATEDISDQYFDTEARIEILEQRRERLMGYLEEATKMDDIVRLESELSDVLYELDQYKGSKRGMDDLVDFARVTVGLREVITAETITSTGDPVGQRAANAYNMSMNGVGQFLQDFAVGFAAAAPVLMLIALILVAIFAVIKLVRFLRKKWNAKFGGKKPPKAPKPPQNMQPPYNPHYPGGQQNMQGQNQGQAPPQNPPNN